MRDKDIYSILIPYVENYFHEEDYSIDKFATTKKKEILNSSIIYVSYDSKRHILYIYNTTNEDEKIEINLKNKTIEGKIEYIFDCNSNINYFDNIGEYIFNYDLIKNILEYTSLGIKGKIKNINKFCICIENEDKNSFDVLNKPIYSLFKNEIEFSTLFNISKNILIDSTDRFMWLFNSAANLKKVSKKEYSFKISVKGIILNDKHISEIRSLDNSNIQSVDFINCKFKLQSEENITFVKRLQDVV